MVTRKRVAVLCVAAFLACSGGTSTTGADGGLVDGLELSVMEAKFSLGVSSVYPKTGNRFVSVHASLANVASATDAPMGPERFSIEVEGNTVYAFAPLGSLLPSACDPSVSVSKGGTHDCWAMFEIPSAVAPVALRYAATGGSIVRALFAEAPRQVLACEASTWDQPQFPPECKPCIASACQAETDALFLAKPACTNLSYKYCLGPPPCCESGRSQLLNPSTCIPAYDAYVLCLALHCVKECALEN